MSLAAIDNSVHCSDGTETPEESAVIEKVVTLAKRYAAGTPREEEFTGAEAAAALSYQNH